MNIGRNIFLSTCIAAFLLFCADISFAQNHSGVRTIVIDPGHGGKDPGCLWGKSYEKDIVLKVSLMLGDMIKKELPDMNVVYTRTTDVNVPLYRRGEIANKAKADLFISIHVNATDKKVAAPSGALTLIMGKEHEGKNLDMAMKENDVISYEDDYTTTYKEYLSGSSEMFIIYSLAQYVNVEQSIVFANMVQNKVKTDTALPDKGIRRQPLLVLWYTTMPGVLIELGFINNETDRKHLVSEKGQRQMAAAIAKAIVEYKQRVESRIAEGQAVAAPAGQGGGSQSSVSSTSQPDKGAAGVVYRIQILSASKKIPSNSSELKEYRGKAYERLDGGRYRYYVGECRTYAEVLELQAQVRKSFKDAFAAAFRNGKPIAIAEARKLTD